MLLFCGDVGSLLLREFGEGSIEVLSVDLLDFSDDALTVEPSIGNGFVPDAELLVLLLLACSLFPLYFILN